MIDPVALLPCPWCGEAMMERHALWPSEGDTDAIIHAKPTECPLTGFSLGTSDEGSSVRAAWNTRAPVEAAKPAAGWMPIESEVDDHTLLVLRAPRLDPGVAFDQIIDGDRYKLVNAKRRALWAEVGYTEFMVIAPAPEPTP